MVEREACMDSQLMMHLIWWVNFCFFSWFPSMFLLSLVYSLFEVIDNSACFLCAYDVCHHHLLCKWQGSNCTTCNPDVVLVGLKSNDGGSPLLISNPSTFLSNDCAHTYPSVAFMSNIIFPAHFWFFMWSHVIISLQWSLKSLSVIVMTSATYYLFTTEFYKSWSTPHQK